MAHKLATKSTPIPELISLTLRSFLVGFFSKKLPIVVVRDVCPSVRPSVVCGNIFFSR